MNVWPPTVSTGPRCLTSSPSEASRATTRWISWTRSMRCPTWTAPGLLSMAAAALRLNDPLWGHALPSPPSVALFQSVRCIGNQSRGSWALGQDVPRDLHATLPRPRRSSVEGKQGSRSQACPFVLQEHSGDQGQWLQSAPLAIPAQSCSSSLPPSSVTVPSETPSEPY